jgi:hypothetical protein
MADITFTRDAAPAAAPGITFKRDNAPAAPPQEEQQTGLSRIWNMLVAPSGATTAGRVKMGIGDPLYGGAQMGAHMADVPLMSPEMPIVPAGQTPTQDYGKQLDTMVQQRETTYENQRLAEARRAQQAELPADTDPEARAMMPAPKLATDWARLVGSVASPVNVAEAAAVPGVGAAGGVAERALPLAARALNAARTGATTGALVGPVGALSQPVTGGDFGSGKLAQAGGGLVAGPVLGAAAAPVGTALGAGVRGLLGSPAQSAADVAERRIQEGFAQGVGIPKRGINNAADLADFNQKAVTVAKDVAANKQDLALTGPRGKEVYGQLPINRQQGNEAVYQRKGTIFKQFDDLPKQADASTTAAPQNINKFQVELQKANRAEGEARVAAHEAQDALNYTVGKPLKVYNAALNKAEAAQRAVADAMAKKEAAQRNLSRPWVDLKPVASELTAFTNNPVNKLTSKAIDYAMEKAEGYGQEEAWTGQQTQEAIKNLNAGLKAFYATPTHDTVSRAAVDEMIASKLREGLDHMVSGVTGAPYQEFKNLYGAYSAVEQAFTAAAIKSLNRAEGGIFANARSMGDVLHIASGLPTHALVRVARLLENSEKNADRAIANMFRSADRAVAGPPPAMTFTRRLAGTSAGGAAARPMSDLPGADDHVVPPPGAP